MVFGLQGGLVNKTFDQNGLYFSEQYTPGMGYDPTLPSGENFADNNSMYADFNAGVFIFDGNPLKVANPFVGYSIFHLLRPKESLFRSEEHTSELQSLMRISYAVFCLKKKKIHILSTYNNLT